MLPTWGGALCCAVPEYLVELSGWGGVKLHHGHRGPAGSVKDL